MDKHIEEWKRQRGHTKVTQVKQHKKQLPSIGLGKWRKEVEVLEPQGFWEGSADLGHRSLGRGLAWLMLMCSNLEEEPPRNWIQSHGWTSWLLVWWWGSDKAGLGSVRERTGNWTNCHCQIKDHCDNADRGKLVSSPSFLAPSSTPCWQSLAGHQLAK